MSIEQPGRPNASARSHAAQALTTQAVPTPANARRQPKRAVQPGSLTATSAIAPANASAIGHASRTPRANSKVQATCSLLHNAIDVPNVAQGSVLSRQQVRAETFASRNAVRTSPGRNTIDY